MSDEQQGMRLLTLTRLWLFGRYLYRVGDRSLWTPVSHRMLGYAVAVFVPVWVVLALLRVSMGGPGLTYRFVIPGLLVWWALHVVGEGQRPHEPVVSWVRMVWHVVRTPAVRPVRIRERRGRRG